MSFYSVGTTALNAAQLGLSTAGHNISNVNTTGYHRQTITQATNIAIATGAGFIGQGVHVDTIKRVYSQFLDNQVLQASTQGAHLNGYLTQIEQIDGILADPTAGLSPALQNFFKAVGDLSSNPQSVPSRQALLSAGSALATRFQTLSQRFAEVREGVNSQVAESVNSINTYARQIATINEQIVLQTGGTGQTPNDLYDQRDQLVMDLNQLVKATVIRQSDGTFNVFIGNGQPLVVGQDAFRLSTEASAEDPRKLNVAYQYGTSTVPIPDGSLAGGRLGGLLEFRYDTLDTAENALGRVAVALSETFNAQHRLGLDLQGNAGGNFFSALSPTVLTSTGNTGNRAMTASFSSVADLGTDDYRITVMGNAPNSYQLTNLTTGAVTEGLNDTTLANAIPGLTLTPGTAGAFAAGDVFTVQPTRYSARDIMLSSTINTTKIAAAAPVVVSAANSNLGSAKVTDSSVSVATPLATAVTEKGSAYLDASSAGGVEGDLLTFRVRVGNQTQTVRYQVGANAAATNANFVAQLANAVSNINTANSNADLSLNPAANPAGIVSAGGLDITVDNFNRVESVAFSLNAGTVDTNVTDVAFDLSIGGGAAVNIAATGLVNPTAADVNNALYLDAVAKLGANAIVTQAGGVGSGGAISIRTLATASGGGAAISNYTVTGAGLLADTTLAVANAGASAVSVAALNDNASGLGAAATASAISDSAVDNTGLLNFGASASDYTAITDVDAGGMLQLVYDSASGKFRYGGTPTTVDYTPGVAMTINGNMQLTLNGTPANGDVFTIGPNINGVSDNRNALLLAKLQTANTMVGGTSSYQSAYSQLVSFVGNKTAEIQVTGKAQENLLAAAKSSQQELSGVNLDEEAANLLRYQQAYQAAAKMMQIATNMFDTILTIV